MKKRPLVDLAEYFLRVEAPKGAAEIAHWRRVPLSVVLSEAGRGTTRGNATHT